MKDDRQKGRCRSRSALLEDDEQMQQQVLHFVKDDRQKGRMRQLVCTFGA